MAQIRGELFFAPGLLMRDVDLDDAASMVDLYEQRIGGLYFSAVDVLRASSYTLEGALFASAVILAATIEAIARVDLEPRKLDRPITSWLEANVPVSAGQVEDLEDITLARVFEDRFRNGLLHEGYVASLGRLSADSVDAFSVSGTVVTINPFELSSLAQKAFTKYCSALRSGRRDIRRFNQCMRDQFGLEVKMARSERK